MARMQKRGGRWGNFLDSTLDRVADGALFAGVAVWFFTGGADPAIAVAAVLCLVLGMVVSYARAKAEALGFHANVGIAERAERLVSVLVVTGLTGLGLPTVVLFVTLCLLADSEPGDGDPADRHSAPPVAGGTGRYRHGTSRLTAPHGTPAAAPNPSPRADSTAVTRILPRPRPGD